MNSQRIPTLIVFGEEDKIVDRNSLFELDFMLQNSELKFIPGAGHFLHFEDKSILSVYEHYFLAEKETAPDEPVMELPPPAMHDRVIEANY